MNTKPGELVFKTILLLFFITTAIFIAYVLGAGFFYFSPLKLMNSIINHSVIYSLRLTSITVLISLILSVSIALPCAYALSRINLPFKNLTDTIIDLPIIFPPAVIGIFLLGVMASPSGKYLQEVLGIKFTHNYQGIVLIQCAVTISFGIRIFKAVFDSLNPRFEKVSYTLGAGFFQTLRYITLPLAGPGFLAGISIILIRCIAEFEALMIFTGAIQGKTDVISLRIFMEFATGNLEGAFALGGISLGLTFLSLLFLRWVSK